MFEKYKGINDNLIFIDDEILIKVTGWQKWALGAGVGMTLGKGTQIFNQIKNNELVKTFEIINKEDKVNVDMLYRELKKQAQKGSITFDVPLMGAMTITEQDLDKLYQLIRM